MRISCNECNAQYEIPIEKLGSKEKKGKCKKCGGTVVVPARPSETVIDELELHEVETAEMGNDDPSGKASFEWSAGKIIALLAFGVFVYWNITTINSDEMASSPGDFYKGKEVCLQDLIDNPKSRPNELESCRWFELAKLKIAANKSDEEIFEFFSGALEEGKTPGDIEDEFSSFSYAVDRLVSTGHEGARNLLDTMRSSGHLHYRANIQNFVNELRKAAKTGDEKAIENLDRIED